MSGLYNIVFGTQHVTPLVLHLLERTANDFGRFRDAWIERNAAGELRMRVYTRCGGGNREAYEDMFDAMREHPLYVLDEDDDFDCTYASVYFRLPEDAGEKIRRLAANLGFGLPEGWKIEDWAMPTVDMGERWKAAIAAVRGGAL